MTSSMGFFTVATGDEHYYKIARNLLRSYRYHTKNPLPFAILADRENEYTAEFDQVVLLEKPTNSYLDKLSLYDYIPFETGIFIDADCLAYGDLNQIFDHFAQADDFSCYGRVLSLEDKTGWFNYEDLGLLKPQVSYCVGLHGGIYFFRKTEKAAAVFQRAKEISKNYRNYNFKGRFSTPGDEPILALAMALEGVKPIPFRKDGICCYWEYENAMKLHMAKGTAVMCKSGQSTHLVHWGTRFTRGLLYQKQIAALDICRRGGGWISLFLSDRKYDGKIAWEQLQRQLSRVRNKLQRIIRRGR